MEAGVEAGEVAGSLTGLAIVSRFSARGTGRLVAISPCFWTCSTGKGQCVQPLFASLSTLRCACPAGISYNEISFAKLLLADLLARRPPPDHSFLDPRLSFRHHLVSHSRGSTIALGRPEAPSSSGRWFVSNGSNGIV